MKIYVYGRIVGFILITCFAAERKVIAAEGTTATASISAPTESVREKILMDFDWRFAFGNPCDTAKDFNHGTGAFSYFLLRLETETVLPHLSLTTAAGERLICRMIGQSKFRLTSGALTAMVIKRLAEISRKPVSDGIANHSSFPTLIRDSVSALSLMGFSGIQPSGLTGTTWEMNKAATAVLPTMLPNILTTAAIM